ncbi:Lipoyl synthase [Trichinella pseudospiralis]
MNLRTVLIEIVKEMVKVGVIEPASGPRSYPVVRASREKLQMMKSLWAQRNLVTVNRRIMCRVCEIPNIGERNNLSVRQTTRWAPIWAYEDPGKALEEKYLHRVRTVIVAKLTNLEEKKLKTFWNTR